jgi:hypothetical protein
LRSCLVGAIRSEDPNDREKVLEEIAEIYEVAANS